MSVQSVLVEYEDKEQEKVYANSGCLIENKFVITTSNILVTMITKNENVKTVLKSLKPGLSSPETLLKSIPKLNIIVTNGNSYSYKKGRVLALYVSENIRKQILFFFNDWAVDEESKAQQLKEVLSLFFIVEIDYENQIKIDLTQCLRELCVISQQAEINMGNKLIIEGTPFGNRNFFNSHSRGIVSNIFGKEKCFILTDTPTTPGCEGSPIYLKSKKKGILPIGMVLVSLSWWKGEWIGLTLGGSFAGIFSTTLLKPQSLEFTNYDKNLEPISDVMNYSLVQVISNATWGTGILIDKDKGIFLTNSHVVMENDHPVLIWNDVEIKSRVVYKTQENEVYDIAVLVGDLRSLKKTNMRSVTIWKDKVFVGETVYAIGFPLFPRALKLKPTLTRGHLSHVTPTMIKTTCSVLPGSSGGGIFKKDGQLVGIIVCNTKMGDESAAVPRVNMAIPLENIFSIVLNYVKTNDIDELRKLKTENLTVNKEWNFLRSCL